MIANVIILGCGRSGTSIFGELFEHLPSYRYYFEPSSDAVRALDYLAGPVALKVPKLPLGSEMTPGLPILLEDLLAIVPSPRAIFWQVRHPLDAICSLRPGISENWTHNPRPPDWEQWINRPVIERCARHWQFINTEGYAAVRDIATISHYERLVETPKEFALNICARVDFATREAALNIEKWAASVSTLNSSESYNAKHQVRWSTQDHTKRIERWRENLSPAEIEAVRPLLEQAGRAFGYKWPAI